MPGMEHYKKRLIHQLEKPNSAPSVFTVPREDDEIQQGSSASTGSNNQTGEDGQNCKKKDEGLQKVSRKRAVCRSQFRHQNMEIFKLGNSIPTSLCKTKEPYNICTEKNLQMCYQNGAAKKSEMNSNKGLLTEAIINNIEGNKRKDIPLWRSVSLNGEIPEKQNFSSNIIENNYSKGRHILPAVIPEIPVPRKSRGKSCSEDIFRTPIKNVGIKEKNLDAPQDNVQKFSEDNKTTRNIQSVKGDTQTAIEIKKTDENPAKAQGKEANSQGGNHTSTQGSSESDLFNYSPINLSLKNRSTTNEQKCPNSKEKPKNYQHLRYNTIPKQPNNIPRKSQLKVDRVLEENAMERMALQKLIGQTDSRGNNILVTSAIANDLLDPQQSSSIVVIKFPHVQQQMSRMEEVKANSSTENQEMSLEADSAIMSLVNIAKTSVESAFNIMSLPMLNCLYIDLHRHFTFSTMSVWVKIRVDEALKALISYLLVNLFHASNTSKSKECIHKILLLDLRPHMNFLLNSLDVIQQKSKEEFFMQHLLQILSNRGPRDQPMILNRNVQEDIGRPGRDTTFSPPISYFPPQNHQYSSSYHFLNNYYMENLNYPHSGRVPHGNYVNSMFPVQPLIRIQPRPQPQHMDRNLVEDVRKSKTHNGPVHRLKPDLYLPDDRYVVPNNPWIAPPALHLIKTNCHVKSTRDKPKNDRNIVPNMPIDKLPYPTTLESYQINGVENRLQSNIENRPWDVHENNQPQIKKNVLGNTYRLLNDMNSSTDLLVKIKADLTVKTVTPGNVDIMMQKPIHVVDSARNTNTLPADNMLGSTSLVVNRENMEITENNSENMTPRKHIGSDNNLRAPPETTNKAVIASNEVVHPKQQVNKNILPITDSSTANVNGDNVKNQCSAPDIEQLLQATIINKGREASITRETVLQNMELHEKVDPKKIAIANKPDNQESNLEIKEARLSPEHSNILETKIVEDKNVTKAGKDCSENRIVSETVCKDVSTVIIEDTSMEISRGDILGSRNSRIRKDTTDLDDVILERISPDERINNGILYSSAAYDAQKIIKNKEKSRLEQDVSIQKVKESWDRPPKLIKLSSIKRKAMQNGRRIIHKKFITPKSCEDVVIIEDEDDNEIPMGKLDHNQNDIQTEEVNKSLKLTCKLMMKSAQSDENTSQKDLNINKDMNTISEVPISTNTPIIEDISSEEETLEPFHLYSTYDDKIDNPKGIVQKTDVSHCSLVDIETTRLKNANENLFEKPPVYTKPIIPWKVKKFAEESKNHITEIEGGSKSKKEFLKDIVQCEKDDNTLICSANINSDPQPKSVPTYQINIEDVNRSPAKVVTESNTSPNVQRPLEFKSPTKLVSKSPEVLQRSPIIPMSPLGHSTPTSPSVWSESNFNLKQSFSEKRKNVFNFERSQSMDSSILSESLGTPNSIGSDGSPKFPPIGALFEVKIDGKVYRVKRMIYEKIPKGKLCYIRESNRFIRYFDDNQMHLFIKNLSMAEGGSNAAANLQKQIKRPANWVGDVATPMDPYDSGGKGEVIILSDDIVFSTDDDLLDPELYVEEVEKVERYAPKDFYGFYKFVTGYQIVNHHSPISFQTFLIMHNTNGLKDLLKSYVHTLIEGQST